MRPESLMMSLGYDSEMSQGAVKSPIFQTSTFEFKSAEEGKAFFELAYGLKDKEEGEELGLIYSRLNNPNLEMLENRLSVWDGADDSAVFSSGMAAISTTMLEFLKPGDLLLYSRPVYGGTDHFVNHVLASFGIHAVGFQAGMTEEEIIQLIKDSGHAEGFGLIHIETPANPTNALIDIEMCSRIAKYFSTEDRQVILTVDNTYMGPLWQHPLKHGADLVVYSATKYIGGHSDLIAGVVSGSQELMARIKGMRTFFGNMTTPYTAWLMMRSLETLKVRMNEQARNAKEVAVFLKNHPKVEKVYYLGFIEEEGDEVQTQIYRKQYESDGAMIAFDIKGGEKAAFKFLNSLKLMKLAVSLGGTESLAEHPATMTHADVPEEDKKHINLTENLVRLSIGIEHYVDLIDDIEQALG